MEYKVVSDIYGFCYDVLTDAAILADDNNNPNQLLLFLTVDGHEDEKCFERYQSFNIKENYLYYKKIMISMLITSFYMNELHDYEKGISSSILDKIDFDTVKTEDIIKEFYEASIDYQEQLASEDLDGELDSDEELSDDLELEASEDLADELDSDEELSDDLELDFDEDSEHPIVDILIDDFINVLDCSFMYHTEAVDIAIQPKSLSNIMRINPLFPLVFVDTYLEMNASERMIKNFRDVYDSMINNIRKDEVEQHQYFIEKLEALYKFDYNKSKKCILYILSFIYGSIALHNSNNDERFNEYKIIKEIQEKADDVEELVTMFYNDEKFFFLVIDTFLTYEVDFYKDVALNIHEELNKSEDEQKIKVFKKYNVLYEEEEQLISK